MSAPRAVDGFYASGDDADRSWDEAEAVLRACDDLEAVMATIRDAESPVEARRALKFEFGFTGRQAALLLTLPVLAFTRSERERLSGGRNARIALLADVTGRIPVIRDEPVSDRAPRAAPDRASRPASAPTSDPSWGYVAPPPEPAADLGSVLREWSTGIDEAMDAIHAAVGAEPASAQVGDLGCPARPVQATAGQRPTAPATGPDSARTSTRAERRRSGGESSALVLDEQIGELCDAIAHVVSAEPPLSAWADDPRDAHGLTGSFLDASGVDDSTGIRTLLWHLRRTGLVGVPGLLPFVDLLAGADAVDVRAARFEEAVAAGALGSDPSSGGAWASGLWPIADRRGYGYAVSHRRDRRPGAVRAYGGGEPLHLLWDSVVDMLADLYRALTEAHPCDAALAAVVDGRVVWTDLA